LAVRPKEEDMAVFRKHLQPYLDALVCPICKGNDWEVGGPVMETVQPGPGTIMSYGAVVGRSEMFPLVFMLCTTCSFVHHFAWEPLLAAVKKKAQQQNG
jgi:hypothetical protein